MPTKIYFENYYKNNKEKINQASKIYYENNKEKISERRRIRYLNNKEKELEQQKKYRENNREKYKELAKIYYDMNQEKIKNKRKIYHKNNKEKINNRIRIWGEKNRERRIEYLKRYRYNRYRADPNFKLRQNLSRRVRQELKKHVLKKTQSTLLYVGCSMEQLKKYLESKFEEGMTWDNWSVDGWHIDHIVPCSSFDLTKEEEQKKCFHYTNLQPLWAKDNLEKSNKLDWVKECA